MASGSTARLKIAYPVPSDTFLVAADIEAAVAAALDQTVPYYQQSSAPVPSGSAQGAVSGQIWWCTNAASVNYGLNYWDGSVWHPISVTANTVAAVSGNTNLFAGEFCKMTGAFTGTLPTPTTGAAITLQSVNGSAGSPATLSSATNGGSIIGPGIGGGAQTLTLQSAGAYVTVIADGTNWNVVSFGTSSTAGSVTSFNTRSGAVTLSKADVTGTGLTYTDVGADASGAAAAAETFATSAVTTETNRATAAENTKAGLAGPAFTGNPTAPTQSPGTNNTRLATTAYTDAAVGVETTRAEGVEATHTSEISTLNGDIGALASDSGWISMAPYAGTGVTSAGQFRGQYYTVRLQGTMAAGGSFTGLLCTLPGGYRPPFTVHGLAFLSGGAIKQIAISTSGAVTSDGSTGTYTIDGITFEVN